MSFGVPVFRIVTNKAVSCCKERLADVAPDLCVKEKRRLRLSLVVMVFKYGEGQGLLGFENGFWTRMSLCELWFRIGDEQGCQ